MRTIHFKRIGAAAGAGGTANVPGLPGFSITFRSGFATVHAEGVIEATLVDMIEKHVYPFGPRHEIVEAAPEDVPPPPAALKTSAILNSKMLKPKAEPIPKDRKPDGAWVGYQEALSIAGCTPKELKGYMKDEKISTRLKESGGAEYFTADLLRLKKGK